MKNITLPWSKSITNRDLILASLTSWESKLRWFLESEDTKYMIEALKLLWIWIEINWDELIINWWTKKISWNWKELFLWNSWTSVRFLTSLAILNNVWNITITGEERMKERPIKDLIDGISQLWVEIESNNWFCPLIIKWKKEINKNYIKMDGSSSSQYFTSLLQIAPLLKNWLILEVEWDLVSKPYIDITINEMNKFWVEVSNFLYKRFEVKSQNYIPVNMNIEWDASAMSYIAAYIVLHWWEIKINNIWANTKQWDYKMLDILKIFWLEYINDNLSTIIKAPWIKKVNLENYRDFEINLESMPDASLTFMILSIFLPGKTYITWLQTLNLKESKRIDSMRNDIMKLLIEVSSDENSIKIWEFKDFQDNKIIDIETYKDHRIAMCFWILDTYIWNLNILNKDCVAKTYPNFWEDLKKINS